MLRTHTCGELTEAAVNEQITLCGWVDARRDHGKIIFIDIRDRYGATQVVFLPKPQEVSELAKRLRSEDVVRITGTVAARPKGTINPKIPTGYVELCAQELEIISAACDLPFTVEDESDAGEEVRLLHRYLDLRRSRIAKNFVLRHKINHSFRGFLNDQNFLEIETPFLTRSTPEGARDFLVPSRLSPNQFYALPQSPQLFKQLLMVGGMDRYYQIVRCFRDEDLRKDRQPEFTQLDMEMSFVQEEDVFALVEKMFAFVFKTALGKELVTPFPRISYSQAMQKYQSDKPDVGEGEFRFLWVIDFPLFDRNEEEGRLQACHHPFTAPNQEDIGLLEGDASKVRARSYDLVCNGEELGSGSVRIHDLALQKKIFQLLGIGEEEAQAKFGFLLRAFQYGAPPHAGIAFGLDRLCAIITGSQSIREVIAFPKTQKGGCPLTAAPSKVDTQQLQDLYLRLVEVEEE